MKTCTACKVSLPFGEFQKNRQSADGLQYRCRGCQAAAMRTWYAKNKARVSENAAAWHKANPEKATAKTAAWNARNSERVKARMATWRAANPAAVCALSGRYRAARRNAVAPWADTELISDLYKLAAALTAAGFPSHVDHIVPLQSRKVCGLHTHDNLTVIPKRENLAKGNRHWPDMP